MVLKETWERDATGNWSGDRDLAEQGALDASTDFKPGHEARFYPETLGHWRVEDDHLWHRVDAPGAEQAFLADAYDQGVMIEIYERA